MGAHRYWRLLLDTANSNARAGIAELEMRGSVGGADMCVGGTPVVSGTTTGAAANVFDNSTATEWSSAAGVGGHWAGYDFGTPVTVVEVAHTQPAAIASCSAWALLQYSDDGVTWVSLAPYATLTLTASATTVFSGFTAPVVTRAGEVSRLNTNWPAGMSSTMGVVGQVIRHDAADGGQYRVAGTVAIDGTPATPVRRRVRLFNTTTARVVREVWSNDDGTFEFANLALAEYIILSDDHTRLYNAVVADKVMAVV